MSESKAADSPTAPRRADYRPAGVDRKTGFFATLKRAVTEFSEDNLTDWAAALTYYGLLSLFPALIALVAVLGLFGDPAATTAKITEIVTKIGPSSAADTFSGPIKSITSNRSGAGVALIVGLVLALWSASGYVGAFMRASNVIYETPEGRPIWKLRPLQMLVTLAMVILMALVALGLVLTGPIVDAVAAPLGIGNTATTIWDIAKWPVLAGVLRAHDRPPLLRLAKRQAARLQVGHAWEHRRTGGLGRRLGGLRASTSPTSAPTTRPTARSAGVVALLVWFWITQPGDPLRPPAQRRARAQPRAAGGRAASRAGDPARAPRRAQEAEDDLRSKAPFSRQSSGLKIG